MKKQIYLAAALVMIITSVQAQMKWDFLSSQAEKIGDHINTSAYDEIIPVIDPTGELLYFSRRNHPDNAGGAGDNVDIWYARRSGSEWGDAKHMEAKLNNGGFNFISSTYDSWKRVIVGAVYHEDGRMSSGPSEASYNGSDWTWPRPLNVQNWYNNNHQVNYHLSSDQKLMVIAAERDDSKGQKDIYISEDKGSYWSEPVNMGSMNTSADETTPFLSADGNVLFFSSNRDGGEGSYDVYAVIKEGSGWSEAINLGSSINSSQSEMYFNIPVSEDYAYFTRGELQGNGDIYTFKLVAPEKAINEVTVSGVVTDEVTGEPLSGARVDHGSGNVTADAQGRYSITLPVGKDYNLQPHADHHISKAFPLSIPAKPDSPNMEKNMALAPVEDVTIALDHVYFDTGKSTLRPESFEELDQAYEQLKNYDGVTMTVEGHTDNVGNRQNNIQLSEDRAHAVRDYLVEKGLDPDSIDYAGHGPDNPRASNDTPDGRQQNRRVELTIH
ncbi:MAG: OmpA family protein [Cyclobacteriaceae bacterium]